MYGVVETASLFTRGSESVRLVRITRADGPSRLLVHGPGVTRETHIHDNAIQCLWFQAGIERALLAEGYQLVRNGTAERRSGRERRAATRGSDRRMPPADAATA
jgi:hypothetical protein